VREPWFLLHKYDTCTDSNGAAFALEDKGEKKVAEKIDVEIEAEGNNWPLLKAGLFGGSLEQLKTAKVKFDNFLSQLSFYQRVMRLNESIVEDAALEWFWELGYAVGHGPHLALGEPAAERDSFGDLLLVRTPWLAHITGRCAMAC
jgi:hypothetical protein